MSETILGSFHFNCLSLFTTLITHPLDCHSTKITSILVNPVHHQSITISPNVFCVHSISYPYTQQGPLSLDMIQIEEEYSIALPAKTALLAVHTGNINHEMLWICSFHFFSGSSCPDIPSLCSSQTTRKRFSVFFPGRAQFHRS